MRVQTARLQKCRRRLYPACALAALAAALIAAARPAAADEFPERPITLVMTFAGGGIMDFATRSIAQHLSVEFGKPVVVDTRVGNSGLIGIASVAKSPPDGHTLVVTAIGPLVFRPIIDKSAGDEIDKEITPVIMIAETPNVVIASPKLGVGTIKELAAYAEKNDRKLTIGHPGVATMGQYCGVLLAAKLGVEGNFIAYRGGTPIVTDLLGGQIDIGTPAFGPSSEAAKILALSSDTRVESKPDVPTLKESGLDMECATWMAIYAPAGVPRPIVLKLNAAIDAYLQKPETRAAFAKVGARPLGGTPERLQNRVASERTFWAPIIAKTLGAAK